MKSSRAQFRLPTFFLASLLCLAAAPLQAGTAHSLGARQPEVLRVQQREISRDEAAARVKKRYGGKILAISETKRNGQPAYRVKGLSDKSQVYVVYVDKRSGRISR